MVRWGNEIKMKYAIYGVNRVAKDFLYIFSELQIVCFFDESYSEEDFIDSSNDNILVERIVSIISKVCESMKLL